MINAQPVQPSAPRRSPASQKPKMPAKTGSIANAIAVREALIRRCAQVWTRKPSALAKIPVTRSAYHTVHPLGSSSWPSATGDDGEARECGEHLRLRERDGVVARRISLHQHDLERVRGGAEQDEQVAARIADTDPREQRQPAHRERDPEPDQPADLRPEEQQAEQRREDDVEPGDEARARDSRPLEPGGLERVAEPQQQAEREARCPPSRPSVRSRGAAGTASTSDAIRKRTARNAKSG